MMSRTMEGVSDRIKVLLHPVRVRVLHALSRREMNTAELGKVLGDVPQATLYRQLRTLLEAGVLVVAGERRVRGIVEKTYALVPERVGLDREKIRGLGRGDLRGYFASFLATLQTDFEDYLSLKKVEPDEDSLHFVERSARLTDEEAKKVVEVLEKTIDGFEGGGTEDEAGRRWRVVGFVSVPVEDHPKRGG